MLFFQRYKLFLNIECFMNFINNYLKLIDNITQMIPPVALK